MKQRRKFLQMLDVRVRQSLSGHHLTSTSRLSRVHSIESLASEYSSAEAAQSFSKTTGIARM